MKKGFGQFNEAKSEAAKEAEDLGLEYRGFGMYADPKTGVVTHRSEGGDLVEIPPHERDGNRGGEEDMGAMVAPEGDTAAAPDVQQGNVLPGEEKAPEELEWVAGPDGSTMPDDIEDDEAPDDAFVSKTNSPKWVAGPDGDNIKNFSFDTFKEEALTEGSRTRADDANPKFDDDQRQRRRIGRDFRRSDNSIANNDRPQEGYAKILKRYSPSVGQDHLHVLGKDAGLDTHQIDPGQKDPNEAKEKATRMGLHSDGHGYWLDAQNNPVAKTVGGSLVMLSDQEKQKLAGDSSNPNDAYVNKAGGVMQQVRGDRPIAGTQQGGVMGTFAKMGRAVRAQAGPETRAKIDKHLDDRVDLGGNDVTRAPYEGDYTKMIRLQKKLEALPKTVEDMRRTEQLNKDAKEYVTDPSYNLDDKGEELGSGIFGSVYMSPDGENVIKEGQLGREELQALDLLKDSKYFPNLVNARFDGPFTHQSVSNNYSGDSPSGAPEEFWDPAEGSDFDSKFPTAPGTFAMSAAKGDTWTYIKDYLDEEQHEQVAEEVFKARAEMHRRGIAHWDMHGGNIFINRDGEDGMRADVPGVTILDLGLARVSRLAALLEGLGGSDAYDKSDTQLAEGLDANYLSDETRDKLIRNKDLLKQKIAKDYDLSDAYGEDDYEATGKTGIMLSDIDSLLEGGIRDQQEVNMETFDNAFDFDQEQLQEYIEILYKGIGEEEKVDEKTAKQKKNAEVMKRMSDAYEAQKKDSDKVRIANKLRAERGEKEIDFKNNKVINPKNLDRTRDDV